MGIWTLIQIVFNIFMACGLFVIVMRMNRAPKDDPRLSRGLQLLQSKIAVLEDLSDRTESQVSQLTAILESKSREVQAKVHLAEQLVQEIRVSMERSLEVAKIFQDKIPHKEIIERQNTIKYVQAARMAHQGSSVDEIAKAVDLPRGEVEFIASVNRERLMFDETELPEWAAGAANADTSAQAAAGASFAAVTASLPSVPLETQEEQTTRLRAEIELAENQRLVENLSRLQTEMQNLDSQLVRENANHDFSAAYDVPKVETESLKKLGEEFRKAVKEGEAADARQPFLPLEQLSALIPNFIEAGEESSANESSPVGQDFRSFAQSILRSSGEAAPLVSKEAAPSSFAQESHTIGEVLRAPIAQPSAPTTIVSGSAASGSTPTPQTSSSDPVLARAVAQSKVQAALRSTAKPAAAASRTQSPELEAARAMAREVAPKATAKSSVQSPVTLANLGGSSPKPKAEKGEVRKVIFPRIDGSDA